MGENQVPNSKEKKTIYDVGYGSIVARNFVAGSAKALGGIAVYLFLGGILYYLSVTYVIPQVRNFIPNSIPFFGPQGATMSEEQLEEAIGLLQQDEAHTPPPLPSQPVEPTQQP